MASGGVGIVLGSTVSGFAGGHLSNQGNQTNDVNQERKCRSRTQGTSTDFILSA